LKNPATRELHFTNSRKKAPDNQVLSGVSGGILCDPQIRNLFNKIHAHLQRAAVFFVFFPRYCKHASVRNQKIPEHFVLRDFVEVGGGFEPP